MGRQSRGNMSDYPRGLRTVACILSPPLPTAAGWVVVPEPVSPPLVIGRRLCGPDCEWYPVCSSRTDIVLPCEGLLPFEIEGEKEG